MTTCMIMSQRRCLMNFCNKNVIFTSQSYSSTSRNNYVSANPVDKKRTAPAPKASKSQVRTIKKLHMENKALFGVLLESKQEKVKRTRKESKLLSSATTTTTTKVKRSSLDKKTLPLLDNESSETVNDEEVDKTLGLILQDENKRLTEMNLLKPGSLPRASSVRLEPAGMSINKNRIKVDALRDSSVMGKSSPVTVRAHKEAEIAWAMRNAPTKIKLIELSPSVTADDESDRAHQSLDEKGKKPCPSQTSRSDFFLPYYNPERSITANDHTENDDAGEYEKSSESVSTIITSFPFPFSKTNTSNNDREASKTTSPFSNAVLVNDVLNSETEKNVIAKNESLQLPSASVKLPSVSKILNATMPKEQAEALRRWELKMIAQMGVEGFRLYKEGILTNGKLLHSNIESYLRGTPPDELHIAEPNQGHWNSLNAVLASVDHVHVLESHVIHPKLQYCGVIDCVAEFRNRLVLIDWKTSQKPKPFVSMTYDTPLQIAAYIGAINYDERYSLKINDGMIVVAYQDGSSCQTFLLSSIDVEKYWKLWVNRLQLFKKMNPPL